MMVKDDCRRLRWRDRKKKDWETDVGQRRDMDLYKIVVH